MKKYILIASFLLVANMISAQKLLTRTGEVKFDASMPNLVEIAGKSNTVSAILDESNGNFAANCLVKSFKFKSPLMEEHYNENYMESSKFPNSKFVGKVAGFSAAKLSDAKTSYDLEGDFTLHGVTKKIKTKITLSQSGGKVLATGMFTVHAQDYAIEIPSLVKEKFAEQIKVSFNFELEGK